MKKKVVVIGGGIAGLSAGVYALRCGFDVTVLEGHTIAGGNCTSWKRGGFLFEGGMHWLTGSNEKEPIHKMWRLLGALDDSVTVQYSEPFMEYNHKGLPVRFYRDVDKTEKHLLDLSPADAKAIKEFTGNIRKVKNLSLQVIDLRGVKGTKRPKLQLSLLGSVLSAVPLMRKFSKITAEQYANRFSHEGIREMLRYATSLGNGVLPLFFTLGILARGDGGFPEGGSLPFAGRIVRTFENMGGEILYSSRASRVIVEGGKAKGVIAEGKRFDADAVIVAADTMAMDYLFDSPPQAAWLKEMRTVTKPTMGVLVSLGIGADLKKYPKSYSFKLKKPFKLADRTYEYLEINNYATDPIYSPEGKSAVTTILIGDTYDFWKKAREEDRYGEEKQKIADEVAAAIAVQMPEADGKVEVVDVATPLTYEKYCGNWRGSWMTDMKPGMKMTTYPAVIKGLDGVYFAGQRMTPPGGLPVALMSGRSAVQYLCRDTGTLFVSEE